LSTVNGTQCTLCPHATAPPLISGNRPFSPRSKQVMVFNLAKLPTSPVPRFVLLGPLYTRYFFLPSLFSVRIGHLFLLTMNVTAPYLCSITDRPKFRPRIPEQISSMAAIRPLSNSQPTTRGFTRLPSFPPPYFCKHVLGSGRRFVSIFPPGPPLDALDFFFF